LTLLGEANARSQGGTHNPETRIRLLEPDIDIPGRQSNCESNPGMNAAARMTT
jgi:hypothetical protein